MSPLSTLEFLTYLRSLNIKLSTDGQRLRYEAVPDAVTPGLRSELTARKAEIIKFLTEARLAVHPQARITPISRDGELPLSFGQLRLWLLDQLEPGRATYNIASLFRFNGSFNILVFERSLNEIVRRHEVLRTYFVNVEGSPVQRIAAAEPFRIPVVDCEALPQTSKPQEVAQAAFRDATQPFDLERAPLLRAQVLRLAAEEHVLLLNVHHIAFDGWSVGVLAAELSHLYNAFLKGDPSPLPEPSIQYVDFAAWQQQWMQGEVLQRQLNYWKARLSGNLPVLQLSTDSPRPQSQSNHGGNVSFALSTKLTASLKRLSLQEDVTLFVTLLAALQVLLHRYTGQDDVSVGTPIANRNRPEIEDLLGFFVNTLVMRADLSNNPRFRALLRQVQETALGAYANQDLPFEKLVAELHPERDPGRTPIFQVMFSFLNTPIKLFEFDGLAPCRPEFHNGGAKFDLSLYMEEVGQELTGWFSYSAELFDETTIERMVGHFKTLLEGIASNPEQSVNQLPVLTDAERLRVLIEWNGTDADYPRDECIHTLFEAQVERTLGDVAVVCGARHLTFQQLNEQANQLAHHLRGLGVGPGTVVGVSLERSIEMVVALLAVLKAGGAYVPLDPSHPRERLVFILADSRAAVVLAQRASCGWLRGDGVRVVWLDDCSTATAKEPKSNPVTKTGAADLAYIIYTSGSTGQPKGVMASHRGAINRFSWMWRNYPFEAEVCCQKTSLSFVDSVWEIFGPLLRGIRLVIVPDDVVKDPVRLVRTLAAERITRIVLVPSLLRTMLDVSDGLKERLPQLKLWISSGEALGPELAGRFLESMPGCTLLNLYGSSEVAADVTSHEVGSGSPVGRVPIGRPIDNTQIYLLDPNLQPVPIGVVGEIFVGGDGLAQGYVDRPALTAEKFIVNPFDPARSPRLYRTGDRARYRADGNLEFLGRLDHQIKLRGFRVELEEIQASLKSHPAVGEAVVIVRGDADDTRLAACVVPTPGQSPATSELRDFLRARLPEYMLPASIVLLDALPLTSSGKLDRVRLAALHEIESVTSEERIEPRDECERRLVAIWEGLLKVSPIGVRDNYFDLGGHSLLAVRLFSEINRRFGVNLPLSMLLRAPTIEQLAEILREDAPSTSVVPGRPQNSRPPLRFGFVEAVRRSLIERRDGSE